LFWRIDAHYYKRAGFGGALEKDYTKKPIHESALEFLKIVKSGKVQAKQFKTISSQLGLSISTYYTIVRKLTDAGLVYKKDGVFYLSDEFALRCNELAGVWRNFKESGV